MLKLSSYPYAAKFINFFSFLLLSSHCFAYDDLGHQVTSAIASKLLNGSRAEYEISRLLNSGENLQTASIWLDCLQEKNKCSKPLDREMKSFIEHNPANVLYHYSSIPFQSTEYHDHQVGASKNDIVNVLDEALGLLSEWKSAKNNPRFITRRQALLIAVHLIGDIHQPLNVSTAYISDKSFFVYPIKIPDISNGSVIDAHNGHWLFLGRDDLYSLWNAGYVERLMKQFNAATPEQLAQIIITHQLKPPYDDQKDFTNWPTLWANETLKISKFAFGDLKIDYTYSTIDESRVHPIWSVKANDGYSKKAVEITERQLWLAGYRIAKLFKHVWPD